MRNFKILPMILLVMSIFGIWALSNQNTTRNHISTYIMIPKAVVGPELNSMNGFGVALVLNGFGAVGTGYYLRRRNKCKNTWRYASIHATRLMMFVDTALSILVMLAVSPVLLAVGITSLKSTNPKVYVPNN